MAAETTDAREARDYALNAQEPKDADELDELQLKNQRLARIQEYEEAAVSRTDPLAAVIGMGNADLQRIFEHLGAAILDAIDSRSHTVEELRELAPDIRLLVKLRNAIETDLAFQSTDITSQGAALPHGMRPNRPHAKEPTNKRDLVPKSWSGQTSF
jgi:hypothetical protein